MGPSRKLSPEAFDLLEKLLTLGTHTSHSITRKRLQLDFFSLRITAIGGLLFVLFALKLCSGIVILLPLSQC